MKASSGLDIKKTFTIADKYMVYPRSFKTDKNWELKVIESNRKRKFSGILKSISV
jgi:hypothetical protein